MKIWILNHYAVPPGSAGGTRHFDLARRLVQWGHAVTIFASNIDYTTRSHDQLNPNETHRSEVIDGVEFVRLRTFPYQRNDWRRILNMLSYAWQAERVGAARPDRPEVVIGSSVHLLAGWAAYRLACRKHASFFFEVRDLWPQTMIDLGAYRESHPIIAILRGVEKFLYRRARKIVVLLPGAAPYIAQQGIPSAKIVHIPNGVDAENFLNPSVPLPESLNQALSALKEKQKFLVAYLGAHGVANALDTVLEAAHRLQLTNAKTGHFILIGDGAEKPRLIERSHELELDNVSFFDPIPKASIPSLFQKIDATVMVFKNSSLYRYGISPNKLWDYLVAARPTILAVNSTNNPVSEAQCGLAIPPADPQALAEAVRTLYNMSEIDRLKMGRRGRDYVLKYHDISILARKFLETLQT
jgi:glycosyltransferase involved in cell wall biosynthesis